MNKTYNNNPKQAGNNMNNDRTNRIVCSSLVARLLKNPARLLRTFSLKSYLTFLSSSSSAFTRGRKQVSTDNTVKAGAFITSD